MRLLDKNTPNKILIGCASQDLVMAPCSGKATCPQRFIFFAAKKSWVDGGYKDGIFRDK